MKIFTVIVCDRHTDPEPISFTSKEAALIEAKEVLDSYTKESGEGFENHSKTDLPVYTWNEEGDYIFVVEHELY